MSWLQLRTHLYQRKRPHSLSRRRPIDPVQRGGEKQGNKKRGAGGASGQKKNRRATKRSHHPLLQGKINYPRDSHTKNILECLDPASHQDVLTGRKKKGKTKKSHILLHCDLLRWLRRKIKTPPIESYQSICPGITR